MRVRIASVVAGSAAAALIALPAAASAATKVVYAGIPPGFIKSKLLPTLPRAEQKALKALKANDTPTLDAFRISKVTINQGDTVKWLGLAQSFHTVDLPGPNGKDLPFFVPNPPPPITGLKDSAGTPFWFNGQPSIGFNPMLFAPIGTHKYNGGARIDSGLPGGPSGPFKVKFTKPGTYKYFCDIHPGMVGYVVVRARSKPVPSAAQDAATLTKQIKADLRSFVRISKRHAPTNTVDLGQSDGKGAELLAMFPGRLSVSAGTTVTFSEAKGSREAHTAAFGPVPLLTTLANSFGNGAPSQVALHRSDNPALGPIQLSPTLHGDGFASTGVLDTDRTTPIPSSSQITFTKAGTYQFVCLIHPFMRGIIVVH